MVLPKEFPLGRHKEIDRDVTRLIAREIGVAWTEFKKKIN